MNKEYYTRLKNAFRLSKKLKKHAPLIISAVLFGILAQLCLIASSTFASYMIGLAITGDLSSHAVKYLIILAGIILCSSICSYLESFLAHKAAFTILAEFRIDLYDSIEKVSPQILLNMRSGQLASTLMSDVEVLEWFYAHTAGTLIVAIVVPIIVLSYLGSISMYLVGLLVVFLLLSLYIPYVMHRRADMEGQKVRDSLADANAVTVEGIHGQKEILMLNFKEKYRQKNEAFMQKLYDNQIVYERRLGSEGALIDITVGVAMIAVALLCISLVFSGKIDRSMYPMLIIFSVMIFNPVVTISKMARNFGIITGAADRVFRVMNAEPNVKDNACDIDPQSIKGEVEFQHVSFRYDKDLPNAVDDISFTIEPGQMLAIVGHSGAGKTTTANLLLRYWDVGSGAIKIGGHDIRDMSLKTLRSLTSAVLQDVYLFNTSIMENIRLANPDASNEEVIHAAELAMADGFIRNLANGYDTIVGERGALLSGGERQRIAIARALLKNSPILILDEAVSALDTENEELLQKAFSRISKNRTTLVIAHRLSTIQNADKLLVMDKGKIVECGTHESLIKEDGLYKELMKYQMSPL